MAEPEVKPKTKQRDFLANYRDSLHQFILLKDRPEYREFFRGLSAELYRVAQSVHDWNARFPPPGSRPPGTVDPMGICIEEDDVGYWELALDVAEVIFPLLKGCMERFGLRFFLPLPRPSIEYLPKLLDPDNPDVNGIPVDIQHFFIPRMFHSYESYESHKGAEYLRSIFISYASMERRRDPDFDNHLVYTMRCAGYTAKEIGESININPKTIEKKFEKYFSEVHGREYDPLEDRTRLPDPLSFKYFLREKCQNCLERASCRKTCYQIDVYADMDYVYLREMQVKGGVIVYNNEKTFRGPGIPLSDEIIDAPFPRDIPPWERKIISDHPPYLDGLQDLIRVVSSEQWADWKKNNIKHGGFVRDEPKEWKISYRMLTPEAEEE